jgi:hypothetical protein
MYMKTCRRCKENKEIKEFYKNKSEKDGLMYICKFCFRKEQKPYKIKNIEKHRETKRLYERKRMQDPIYREKQREKSRKYYLKNKNNYKGRKHKFRILKTYGISDEDFLKMLEKQKNLCSLCGIYLNKRKNIDHCHKTGKIRGILCTNCNMGLGLFKDSKEILGKAIIYLSN